MKKTERSSKLDILRIAAAISVVLLHVSSDYIDAFGVRTMDFNVAVFLNSLTRFAVPVFVMISGELFLNPDKETGIKKIWKHSILRLFMLYLVWSYGYYVFQSLYFWKFPFYKQGIVRTATGIVYATNHLWFIWMLIGLYALTPIIKSWLKSAEEKNIRYFIDIFFVFQIVRTTVALLINKSLTDEISRLMSVAELSGYLGYYVLGYYLSKYEIRKNLRSALYVCAPFGVMINFAVSVIYSRMRGSYTPGIYDSFGVFTFFNCIVLYLLVGSVSKKIGPSPKILSNLAADTLGMYLSHIMIWEVFKKQFGMDFTGNTFLSIILYTLIISVCTVPVSALLRRIPYVGRYLA